jgi:hypothetical protein
MPFIYYQKKIGIHWPISQMAFLVPPSRSLGRELEIDSVKLELVARMRGAPSAAGGRSSRWKK